MDITKGIDMSWRILEDLIILSRQQGRGIRYIRPLFTSQPGENKDTLFKVVVTWYDSSRSHFQRVAGGGWFVSDSPTPEEGGKSV